VGFRILEDYPRRPHLEFFRRNPHPFYSVTFELEATRVRAGARKAGGSTYAGLCWAFHRALLRVEAFRVRAHGEDVVLYESLRMGMTVPAPGRTFSFASPPWHDDGPAFLRAAAPVLAEASRAVDLSGGNAPDFAYYTALPRVPFASFAHVPAADPGDGQPNVAFGRFQDEGGRVTVPVGLTVNHRYVDGADLGDLYDAACESYGSAF
jgi:chloramphenicol O-acetyltransferase type A